MPLKHALTPAQLAALHEVLRGRAPASSMRLEYKAGGRDLGVTPRGNSYQPLSAEWGRQSAEEPALEFTGVFRQSLPSSLRRETLTVDLTVATRLGELSFRRFTGRIARVKARKTGTEVQANSGGYYLDKVRLDERVSYVDVAPSEVVWDAVTRAAESGVYDLRFASIEEVLGPKVRREEFLLNIETDKLARPIAAAVEEADLFFRDGPHNGPLCDRNRGPAEATGSEWDYTAGVDAELEPEETGDEYDAVVPYRVRPDGTLEFPLETGGDPETRGIKIPGSTAPRLASYEINLSDGSETATEDLYQAAFEAAQRLIGGESTATPVLRWIHPLLVDGDFVAWSEPFEEERDGVAREGTRRWIAKIETLKETHDLTQEQSLLMVEAGETLEPLRKVAAYPAGRGNE